MKRRVRRAGGEEAEDFPMTPMIDMVFLLLVFFMCVSSLAKAEKRIPLPLPESSESKVPENVAGRGVVTVMADGRLWLGALSVDRAELARRVREEAGRQPRLKVQIRAEQEVTFATLRDVLKICAEAGVADILYATVVAEGR